MPAREKHIYYWNEAAQNIINAKGMVFSGIPRETFPLPTSPKLVMPFPFTFVRPGLNCGTVKRLLGITVGVFLLGAAVFPVKAAFTSFWIFGDGVCNTTNNHNDPSLATNYYGVRSCNGRVWSEVLAEWQGISFDSNKNWSYWGDDSYNTNLLIHITNFVAPSDSNTALYAIWVADSDFVDDMGNLYGTVGASSPGLWTNTVFQQLTNHWNAITNLYGKGARYMVLPNAVDITKIPLYDQIPAGDKTFVRRFVTNFNVGYTNIMRQITNLYPDLTIYAPDAFSLLNDVVAHPANYGVTNALDAGQSVDALDDPNLSDFSLDGPGSQYIFWDPTDPTSKVQMYLADIAQKLISPAQITKIVGLKGSNRLDVVNVPIGRDGTVDFTTSLKVPNWTAVTNVDTNFPTQSIFVTPTPPDTAEYYRLHFPFVWTWP